MRLLRARASAPGRRTKGALAVDVRRDVVHLAYLEGRPSRVTRAIVRREPVDASLYSASPAEAVAAAIARLARSIDLASATASIVLASNREVLRTKRFPAMKPRDLSAAVALAMQSGFLDEPSPTQRHFLQGEPADENGRRQVEAVLLEASSAAIAEARALASAAGLRLARVASPVLALGRAVSAAGHDRFVSLVVDLSGPVTTINAYAHGRFLLSREADVEGDLFSEDLADVIAIGGGAPAADAEARGTARVAARVLGQINPAGGPPAVSAAKLKTEIVRSNRYLVTHHRASVERIWIAGPTAEASALVGRLGDSEVPVALLDPAAILAGCAIDGQPEPASARCVGAALELLAPARARRYNLLRAERAPHPARPAAIAAAALIACGAAAALALLHGRNARLDGEIAELRARVASATEALVLPGANVDPARVESRLALYRTLRDSEPRWSPALHAIAAALPDGVWLTGLELAPGDGDDGAALEEILARVESADIEDDAAAAPGVTASREVALLVSGRAISLDAIPQFLDRMAASGALGAARVVTLSAPGTSEADGEALDAPGAHAEPDYRFVVSVTPDLFNARAAGAL